MKVLDLQCSHGHGFEGWFGSEDDFRSQLDRGLIECPLCGSHTVSKLPSAPRLNLGAAEPPARHTADRAADRTAEHAAEHPAAPAAERGVRPGAPPAAGRTDLVTTPDARLQAAWLKAVREVMARTEDVGDRFAEEARRMHYGEIAERGIRGQATLEDTQALIDEGIGVLPLALPKALKGPLQ